MSHKVLRMDYKTDAPEHADKSRDELKGKVLALRDLVNYQDGTVASRMIVNRKAGSITLFSFDEDERGCPSTPPPTMRWSPGDPSS
jgi:hypothetical protein